MSEFFMPAETEAHDRIFMAFPASGYTLGDTEKKQKRRDPPGVR
ncbi:hypothetical protein [Glutamicibacter sp. AOP5-A2-18]